MRFNDILRLAVSLIVCQMAGVFGSLFTVPAISTWYQTLNKPSFNPPNWIFSPVWISLYLMMGISLFLVWRKKGHPNLKMTLIFFFIQLILNALWSASFFGLRSPFLGLVNILFLWFAILLMIMYFLKVSKAGAWLLLPYLLWVSFATILNYSLWVLNRKLG